MVRFAQVFVPKSLLDHHQAVFNTNFSKNTNLLLMENGCEDRDECQFNGVCENAPYVTCTNNQGSYECICDAGYTGNGTHCFDVDECASGNVGFSKKLDFLFNKFWKMLKSGHPVLKT